MKYNFITISIVLSLLLSGCSKTVNGHIDRSNQQLPASQEITDVIQGLPSFANVPKPDMGRIPEDLVSNEDEIVGRDVSETETTDLGYPARGIFLVEKVIDGDTIEIEIDEKKERVRLLCIDAPELSKNDPFAEEAKAYLEDNIEGKEVIIEFGTGKYGTGRDAYGRLLGYVFSVNHLIEYNVSLIREGLARVAYIFDEWENAEAYGDAESLAKEEKIGIWSIEGYVTPNGYNRENN
jgi:endonuclease YncB( thermonuclease family)